MLAEEAKEKTKLAKEVLTAALLEKTQDAIHRQAGFGFSVYSTTLKTSNINMYTVLEYFKSQGYDVIQEDLLDDKEATILHIRW